MVPGLPGGLYELEVDGGPYELEGDGGPYELDGDGGGPYELDGEAEVEVDKDGPLCWLFLMLQTSRPSREVLAGHPNWRTSLVRTCLL